MTSSARDFGAADLRAAVAAGILDEAQAASVLALADARSGRRQAMQGEDEPFEFFRGFSEIFVTAGLCILLAGFGMLSAWIGGTPILVSVPVAALVWFLSEYFTRRRRMNLPSMVLVAAFGISVFSAAIWLLADAAPSERLGLIGSALLAAAATLAWFWRFRLPFAMFVLGLFLLVATYGVTAGGAPGLGDLSMGKGLFDLNESPRFALATLLFGIGAFVGGMWFDSRDPHRVSRLSASGFWLHMLAAPALVNTVALTLYNLGGTTGMVATAAAMLVIALLALVIDRRSFLTAGIVYIALLIGWAIRAGDETTSFGEGVAVMLVLGALVTALGAWWVQLRRLVLETLPDFPGKSHLPPHGSAE